MNPFRDINPTAWFWREYAITNDYEQLANYPRSWVKDGTYITVPEACDSFEFAEKCYETNSQALIRWGVKDSISQEEVREMVWEHITHYYTLSGTLLPHDYMPKETGYADAYELTKAVQALHRTIRETVRFRYDENHILYDNGLMTSQDIETYGDLALRLAFVDRATRLLGQPTLAQETSLEQNTQSIVAQSADLVIDVEHTRRELQKMNDARRGMSAYYGYQDIQSYEQARAALKELIK